MEMSKVDTNCKRKIYLHSKVISAFATVYKFCMYFVYTHTSVKTLRVIINLEVEL